MRFLLVDRVDAIRPGESAEGVKCVSLADDALQDHFPDYPLMPGTLIVEALAQLAGLLVECSVNRAGEPLVRAVLGALDQVRFRRPCRPGDTISLRCTLSSTLPSAAQVRGEASVAGEAAASAQLTFALRTIDAPHLHERRRALYRTWTQHLTLPFALP